MHEIAAVGAIAVRDGCLLLIQRGHEPSLGRWSLPGGRVNAGESGPDAVVREVWEETGLRVRVGALAGVVTRPGIGDAHYRIEDYLVDIVGGEIEAGDDAVAVAWVRLNELADYDLTDGLLTALVEWAVIETVEGP